MRFIAFNNRVFHSEAQFVRSNLSFFALLNLLGIHGESGKITRDSDGTQYDQSIGIDTLVLVPNETFSIGDFTIQYTNVPKESNKKGKDILKTDKDDDFMGTNLENIPEKSWSISDYCLLL